MSYKRIFENLLAFAQAIQPDTPIYGVISSLHGSLDKPLIEGETVIYNRLPANINLLLVGSHGNVQVGSSRIQDDRDQNIKRLNVMQKFWTKNLFDEEEISCITKEGEELLANLVTIEFLNKTYREEYGKDLNKQTDRDLRGVTPWFALTNPMKTNLFQDKDFNPNNYTALLKFLKLYKGNEEYNEQLFLCEKLEDVSNFGISFLCTERRNTWDKRFYVFLKLEIFLRKKYGDEISKLVSDGTSFRIKMSEIFEYVQNISTASEINLMHHSCRVVQQWRRDYVDTHRLTKQLSNRKEQNSIYCFIKKFIPEDLQGEILDYFESLKPGIITIFDFYDMLKSRNLFDSFLIAISNFYNNKGVFFLSFFKKLVTEANERKITEEEALREQARLNETTGAFSMYDKDYYDIAQGGGKKRKSRRKGRKSKTKRKRRRKTRRTRRR